MKRIIKKLLVVTGFISMAFGIVGIVIPVLPTTPLLILSYICFLKGSCKFHNWFIESKIYSKHVKDFIENKGLTMRKKIKILIITNTLIIISIFVVKNIYVTIGLFAIMLIKFWAFMFKIKTLSEERNEDEVIE